MSSCLYTAQGDLDCSNWFTKQNNKNVVENFVSWQKKEDIPTTDINYNVANKNCPNVCQNYGGWSNSKLWEFYFIHGILGNPGKYVLRCKCRD
jgi:hypothetical protein